MATQQGMDDLITLLKTIDATNLTNFSTRPIVRKMGEVDAVDGSGDADSGVFEVRNVVITEPTNYGSTVTELYSILVHYYLQAQTADTNLIEVIEEMKRILRVENQDDTRTYDWRVSISYAANINHNIAVMQFDLYKRLVDGTS